MRTSRVHIRSCHPTTRIHLSRLRLHLTSLLSMNLCLKEQTCHALLHVCFRASFCDETRQIITKSQILLLPATQNTTLVMRSINILGLGCLLLGVFWLSRLGRQIVSVRARVEPLGDLHLPTWTQAAISTVIILTTSSPLSGDETNSTTFDDERHSQLELTWCSNGIMHYETVHSGSEEWSCVLQYTFQWLINCKHQELQA
jgi:hypothetical protein